MEGIFFQLTTLAIVLLWFSLPPYIKYEFLSSVRVNLFQNLNPLKKSSAIVFEDFISNRNRRLGDSMIQSISLPVLSLH